MTNFNNVKGIDQAVKEAQENFGFYVYNEPAGEIYFQPAVPNSQPNPNEWDKGCKILYRPDFYSTKSLVEQKETLKEVFEDFEANGWYE